MQTQTDHDSSTSADAEVPTLLILGAGGDLTKRLLLPGLGSLLAVEPHRRVQVIGSDRTEKSVEEWRELVADCLSGMDAPADAVADIAGSAEWRETDVLDEQQLTELIASCTAPLVVYFALPPAVSVQVCELLERIDLPEPTRLALEKPFGSDLQTARELNDQLLRVVPEDHVFRVDHFLGISTVFNLIGLRFANRLFAPVWSCEHISRVEVLYDEDLALEGRAGYYDKAGALRDMLQSHLLLVMAIFAMEPIAAVDAVELRDLVTQALRATHLWDDDVHAAGRRARYTAGRMGDREIPDYVAEDGVDPGRNTETLAELTLEIRNTRWAGVPFVLRSGKALSEPRKQIIVHFKQVPHLPSGFHGHAGPDRIMFDLKPGAVAIELTMNAEGDPLDLEQKVLHATLADPQMVAYGEVLQGVLDGDPLLSVRGDAAEELWRIVGPVLRAWADDEVQMDTYPAGSTGPERWRSSR